VATQVILESVLLATGAAILGIGLGCVATAFAAHRAGKTTSIPLTAPAVGLAAAVGSGRWPAPIRPQGPPASPTDALRSL
jgi:hypothetical protein